MRGINIIQILRYESVPLLHWSARVNFRRNQNGFWLNAFLSKCSLQIEDFTVNLDVAHHNIGDALDLKDRRL